MKIEISDRQYYDVFLEAYNKSVTVTKKPVSLVQFIMIDNSTGKAKSRSELISSEGIANAGELFTRIMEIGAEFSPVQYSLRLVTYGINAKTPDGKHRIATACRNSFGKERHDVFLFDEESNTGLTPEKTSIAEIDGLLGKWGAVGKSAIQDEVMTRFTTAFVSGQNMATV